ncbi:MAG: TonB-dependent receptor [Pseudomonadales bacterium]
MTHPKHRGARKRIFTGVFAATMALAGTANAQKLEEVLVTAQKRVESLQDVPISVAAVSSEKMTDFGITDMENLSAYVPNFTINETGISTTVTIRGISSGVNPGFELSVGMYNDGIYYGRDQLARVPMMDLERVEVLRGPQGILFGKNSIAGAVSMISAKPTDEFEASIRGLYEPDADEKDIRGTISGPITENLSGRLAFLYREMDGYMENTYLDRDEQGEEETFIRGALQWQATDNFVANLKVSRATFDVDGRNVDVFNSIGSPDHLTVLNGIQTALGRPAVGGELDYKRDNNGDLSDNTVDNAALRMDWTLEPFTVTSITGFVGYEYEEICDCDFTAALVVDSDVDSDYSQFSQELRLTSLGGETIDYIAGVFYQTSELYFSDSVNLVDDTILTQVLGGLSPVLAPLANLSASKRNFEQDSDLWAVFAQVTWNINDAWRLTVGGRYTDESKDASKDQQHLSGSNFGSTFLPPEPNGESIPTLYNFMFGAFGIEPYEEVKGDLDETAFTPVVTAQWDATDDTMLYATWTKGFKSGGFDARSNAHPDPAVMNAVNAITGQDLVGTFEFDEEEANSAELGAKMRFAGGRAELNAALYYTEYTDLQVSQFDGTLGFNVTNAGEATAQGVELDGRWAATDSLTLSGGIAYLDFNYDSFPNSQCAFGQAPDSPGYPGLCDATGKRKEYTPEITATLSADWRRPIGNLELRAGLDVNYMDSYLYSAVLDPNTKQDSSAIWNGRIALASVNDTWEVALLGRNLSDETVLNYGGNTPLAGILTQGGGNSYYAFVNRPRNYAVQLSYKF